MAFVENCGARIYWDEAGKGAPVLLIMGLGWPSYMCHRTRPVLAASYRTLAFDNRGVAQSDVPEGPYSIALMASDAAAVLDAAGETSAHIVGMSMGGMIAQEFALQYPERVRSLVLGCTAPGGENAVQPASSVLETLMSPVRNPEEAARAINPFIYDARTSPEHIEEDMVIRRKWFPTLEGYIAQLQAIMNWQSYDRLGQIDADALVLHGETDQLVPPGNAKILAERIRGSKLAMIPHASHIFATDQPLASHRAIQDFLSSVIARNGQSKVE